MKRAVRLVIACISISGCADDAAPFELMLPSRGHEATFATASISMSSVSASQLGDGNRYEGQYDVTLERRSQETEARIDRGDALSSGGMDLGHSVRLGNPRQLDVTLSDGRVLRREGELPAFHTRRMPNGEWLTADASAEAKRQLAAALQRGVRWEGRRSPRLFEAKHSDVALTRLASASESRRALDDDRVEFTMRRGATTTVIVFDRRIGGVVQSTISEPTLGLITTRSSYERVSGGFVLSSQDVSVRARGVERTTRNVFSRDMVDGGAH